MSVEEARTAQRERFEKLAGELHDQVHEAAALVSWPDQKEIGWAPEEAIPILTEALKEQFTAGLREAARIVAPEDSHVHPFEHQKRLCRECNLAAAIRERAKEMEG